MEEVKEKVRTGALGLDRATRFLREVKAEMERVTWPTRSEVRGATVVVIVLVLLIALIIGVMDILIVKINNVILFR